MASATHARLARAAAWLAAQPADAEILILASSPEAGDELARAAALDAGARFGVTRLTLGRLAGRLALPALTAAGRVPAGGLSLDAVAARAVHRLGEGALGYFGPVARRPGFAPAVARTLAELRMQGIAPAALRPLPRVGRDLAALAAGVERELVANALADRAHVFATALATVAAEPASPLVGLPLLLLDVPLATVRESALVAALAARAPSVLATAAAGDERALRHLTDALGCAPEVLPAAEERSLDALQVHLFADSGPAPRALDASVSLHSWPGEGRECVEIARRIQVEAAAGVPYDRMAIFLQAPGEYVAHLEEALGRAAIPAFYARGTTRPESGGRALLALLACKAEGYSVRRFAEYLSLAQVPDPETQTARAAAPEGVWVPPDHDLVPRVVEEAEAAARRADGEDTAAGADVEEPLPRDPAATPVVAGTVHAPWRWEQLLVDAAVIGGHERWARRIDGLRHELALRRAAVAEEDEAHAARLAQELVDLDHLAGYALPLLDRLTALPAEAVWATWLAELRALAAAALREPAQVLATLAELAPMAPVGPVDLDEVQLVLSERLRALTDRPRTRRYGKVFVAPVEAARGLSFDVVFVPGLAEKIFPRKIVEDPILLDASRRALDVPDLTMQAARVEAERLALRLAAGAARHRLVLSYPRIDLEQARPRVPSFYALETLRAAEGRLPDFEEIAARARGAAESRLGWPAPERAEDAIDDAEYDLAHLQDLLDADQDTQVGAARYLLDANVHLARALRARARRWLRRWKPDDGLVDPDEPARAALARHQLAARSYSPTALQNFASCPYRFFLQAVHRLKPREEPVAIETIDPLTRGALFHDVQYRVLTALRDGGGLPVRPAGLQAAHAAVDGILDDVAVQYAERLYPAIPRVWQDGVEAIRADLREWLRRAAEAEDGWVPHRFELSFGLAERDRSHADPASVADPIPVAGALMLRGSIDLVERDPGRETLRVTDHKTGKARATDGVVVGGGEVLQPILYALAAERMLAESVESGRLYYCTSTGEFLERIVSLDGRSRAAAAAVVGIIDRALQDAFLPAAPAERACQYCDYRAVCGPHEAIRTRGKPSNRLADLTRLRGMP